MFGNGAAINFHLPLSQIAQNDSTDTSKVKLKYPFKDKSREEPLEEADEGGLKLKEPSNIKTEVEYDPITGQYNIKKKIGDMDYRSPNYMEMEEYSDYELKKSVKSYWKKRTHAETISQSKPIIPKLHVGGEI